MKIESTKIILAIAIAIGIGDIELWSLPSRIVSEQNRVQAADLRQSVNSDYSKKLSRMFGGGE
jgi:hypothetical protein